MLTALCSGRACRGCAPPRSAAQWFKRQGLVFLLYLGVGSWVFASLEGWPVLDSCYFLIVTATTVGYGDIGPTHAASRLFTSAWALFGIVAILAAIAPALQMVNIARQALERAVVGMLRRCGLRDERAVDHRADLEVVKKRINYTVRYIRALLWPLITLVAGFAMGMVLMGYSAVDAVYWSVVTMTTVGYGDLHPTTAAEKAVAIIYLPLAVTALADALSEVSSIAVRRSIRETDYLKRVDELLLDESQGDPEETLTEGEFLISVLKRRDLVDDATLTAIRLQFSQITRRRSYRPSEPRVLDSRLVFLELVSDGRVRQRPLGTMPGSMASDHTLGGDARPAALVDLSAEDGGFGEWFQEHWLERVRRSSPTGKLRGDPVAALRMAGVGHTLARGTSDTDALNLAGTECCFRWGRGQVRRDGARAAKNKGSRQAGVVAPLV